MNKTLSTEFLRSLFFVFVCVLAGSEVHAQSDGYNFQPVMLAGAFDTGLWDMNNSGVAVGFATIDPHTNATKGVIYAFGTLTAFTGPAGAVSSDLRGITNDGTIYGNYSRMFIDTGMGFTAGPSQIFSYKDGLFSTYAIGGLVSPYVSGVSPSGRWIVGQDSATFQGFVFDTMSAVTTVLRRDGARSFAAGANDAGQIVGYDRTSTFGGGSVGSAWIYTLATGTFEDASIPGNARSAATDINILGIISGYYADSSFQTSQGFTGLGATFRLIIGDGAAITAVRGANDAGVLVGYFGSSSDGPVSGFIASPVPEPATLTLLLFGFATLILMSSRRRLAETHAEKTKALHR